MQTKTAVLCGRNSVQIRPAGKREYDLAKLAELFASQGFPVDSNPYLVSVSFPSHRLVVFRDGRALVHGTKDIQEAKAIYYRYLG